MKKALFLVLIWIVLASCSTINYINIETFKPAEITFPSVVKKVLIVNNAAPQHEQSGYEFKFLGNKQDTARAKADSALFDACRALGMSILETNYFSDVLLFHENTREDNDYLLDRKLSPTTVRTLCEETGADAVISFDRLLFEMNKVINSINPEFYNGIIKVQIAGIVRAYVPQREAPLATVIMTDSIHWTELGVPSLRELERYLPNPEEALREAGNYIGERATPNFVPHWQNEVRWFYSGITTEWKQGAAYASNQKWDNAEKVWESAYNKTKNETQKAKLASNLAFVNEMQGEYSDALKWSEIAANYFKKKGEQSRDYQIQTLYKTGLQERIRENQKLNIQFGDS